MRPTVLNCRWYMEKFLKIRDKQGQVIPLALNEPQSRLYEQVKELRRLGIPVRIVVLKARQMGFSTVISAMVFWAAATARNVMALIMAHVDDASSNLFAMVKRYYDNLPAPVRPARKASNAKELVFASTGEGGPRGMDSAIRVATAGGHGVGRSFTFRVAHLSEFAFWPGNKMEILNGIMQAVPDKPGTMVFVESTANGFDQFKDLWDEAVAAWNRGERDGWCPFFAAWHEMKEYSRKVPPGFERTEEEEALAQTYSLDDEQLAWRRWCIKVNCGGDVQLFKQEYPASPEEAFLASGSCWFNQEAIVLQLERSKGACRARGRFVYAYDGVTVSDIRWEDDEDGEISIYREPGLRVPYVIGGDTAGDSGGEWSDFFAGHVVDNITGQQAAVLHGKMDEDEYARQVYCLGAWYNWALIAVETNFSTHPTKELERLRYPRMYVREVADTFTGKTKKAHGFQTTRVTRPVITAQLQEVMRDEPHLVEDGDTLMEMLSFAKNERGRPEALPGKHDDLVMALAIAHQARGQQLMRLLDVEDEPDRDEEDPMEYEDYMTGGGAGSGYMDF